MLVRLETPKERQKARLTYIHDELFLFSHEYLKQKNLNVSVEEIFETANVFARYVLENNITERSFLEYDVDDLKAELYNDDDSCLAILTIAFLLLGAVRKKYSNAEKVARALISFCQEYSDFTEYLDNLNRKEVERWVENQKVNLLTYELKLSSASKVEAMSARQIIDTLIEATDNHPISDLYSLRQLFVEASHNSGVGLNEDISRLNDIIRNRESRTYIENQNNTNCQQFGSVSNSTFVNQNDRQ